MLEVSTYFLNFIAQMLTSATYSLHLGFLWQLSPTQVWTLEQMSKPNSKNPQPGISLAHRRHLRRRPHHSHHWRRKIISCNVTRYPNSCFTSIISLNSSPELISLNELSNLPRSLKSQIANGDGGAALKDCVRQIVERYSNMDE